MYSTSVSDPHSLNADADPDPGFYFNVDPDPDPDSGFRTLDPDPRFFAKKLQILKNFTKF